MRDSVPTNRTALSGQEGHEKKEMVPVSMRPLVGAVSRLSVPVAILENAKEGVVSVAVPAVLNDERDEVSDDLHRTLFHDDVLSSNTPAPTTRCIIAGSTSRSVQSNSAKPPPALLVQLLC